MFDVARKSVLLLNLVPGVLFAKDKLEDPTKVPPTTGDPISDTRTRSHFVVGMTLGILFAESKLKDPNKITTVAKNQITDTRGHSQTAVVNASFEDGKVSLEAMIESGDVFVENRAIVTGTDYLDWNSDLEQFQSNGFASGLAVNKMVLVDSGTISESTMSELFNAILLKQNLWSDSGGTIRRYNSDTDNYDLAVDLRSFPRDAVEVEVNDDLCYIDDNILYDGTTSVDVEVTVNVEAVAVGNSAPIIAAMEDVTFNEDEVVSTVVGVNISDVDGDTPTVSVSSSNVNVTAEFNNNNNIILNFAENFNTESSGPVTITVTADDGNGGVARRTFEVRVNAVDDAPTKVGNIEDRVSTVANGPITIPASELNVAFDDIDNDNADFIYSVTSNDEGVATVTIDGNNNLITTPQGGLGVTTITLNVESEGKASAETFTITIEKPNRHVDLEDINNGNNLVESNKYTFPPSVLGFDNSYKVEELDAAFHAIRWVDEGLFIHTASVDVRTNVDVVFENDTEAVTLTIPIDNINVEVQNITNIYLHRNITFSYSTGGNSTGGRASGNMGNLGVGIRVIMAQEGVEEEGDIRIRPVLSFDNGSNPDATRSYDPVDFNKSGSLTVFEEDVEKQGYDNGGNVEMMATFQVEKKADGVLLGNVLQGIEAIYVADVTHEVSIPDTLTGGMAEVVISHPANVHVEATLLMGVNGDKKVSLEVVDQGSTNSTVQFDGTQYPVGQLEVKTNIGPVKYVSAADFHFTVTGIEDAFEKFEIKHYPIPALSGQPVNTDINLREAELVNIEIFDATGQFVSGQAVYLSNGEHTLRTGITDLSLGIYLMRVEVEGEEGISTQRIVVQ